jgi:glycosyltransferase involved in cell wall biosynthesis
MNEPLASILIAAYNHETYIQSALGSVAADGYPRVEVIILDDGSQDGTLAVAQAWASRHASHFERIEVLTQSNQGVCRTLNRLVSCAQGEYLAFLASDDELVAGGISLRMKALQEHPSWLAVIGDAEMINGEGRQLCKSALVEEFRADKHALLDSRTRCLELLLHWCVPGPVFMARREAFDPDQGVGPYDEGFVFEDRDYYARLLSRRALGFVDAVVARYRVHDRNMCRGQAEHYGMSEQFLQMEIRNRSRFRGLEGLAVAMNIANLESRRPGATRFQKIRGSLSRRFMRWLRQWNSARVGPQES